MWLLKFLQSYQEPSYIKVNMEAVWTIDALISHGSQEQIQLVVKGNALPQLCRLLQSSNSQVCKLYYSGWVDVLKFWVIIR